MTRRGRPRACPDDLLLRVVEMRRSNLSHEEISRRLNADGITTSTGRPRWWRSYVWRLLDTGDGRRLLAADDPAAELKALDLERAPGSTVER